MTMPPLLDISLDLVKFPFYYYMLIIAIGAVYMSYRIRHSKFGLGLRAISQDEIKAEVAGIPTSYYKILAFGISGLFVGMAGGIWGYYLTYLKPNIFLLIILAAQLVLMTVLGGKGTVAGPVVGAILFIAINEFFVTNLGYTELNIVATGLILALVLIFFPSGIVGSLRERGKLPPFLDWD
jgi:branched-chain amino acid transport system permease protein